MQVNVNKWTIKILRDLNDLKYEQRFMGESMQFLLHDKMSQ